MPPRLGAGVLLLPKNRSLAFALPSLLNNKGTIFKYETKSSPLKTAGDKEMDLWGCTRVATSPREGTSSSLDAHLADPSLRDRTRIYRKKPQECGKPSLADTRAKGPKVGLSHLQQC